MRYVAFDCNAMKYALVFDSVLYAHAKTATVRGQEQIVSYTTHHLQLGRGSHINFLYWETMRSKIFMRGGASHSNA